MAMADDLRKTLTDPTPLYFAAGTADIAVERARKVPELIEQLRAEAPGRVDAVRRADPRAVQDKATARAREAQASVQAKVVELLGSIDRDPRKLTETAQGLALRGVGVALEYAVKARETYERVAERGEQSVRAWRGEAAEDITEIAIAVEPGSEPRKPRAKSGETPVATEPEPKGPAAPRASRSSAPRKAAPPRKAGTPRKAAKKTPPPAEDA